MKLDLKNIERTAIVLAEKKNISVDEAEDLLLRSTIVLEAGDEIKRSYTLQVAFLTCYNAGARIFKGGVFCEIPEDIPNLTDIIGETFNEVLDSLFSLLPNQMLSSSYPKILFGKSPQKVNEVEVVCSGWQGGLNFCDSEKFILNNSYTKVPLGGALASSYALFWAFNRTFSMTEDLWSESFGYSLWDNSLESDWNESKGEGPVEIRLPSKVWIVGLGHLGQAYLWILSLLSGNKNVEMLLQDYDVLGKENLGAQLLSFAPQIGFYKTRICSEFIEKVGFKSRILEKKFNGADQQDTSLKDFEVLITGLDNLASRREINPDRFKICLDGATNGKVLNFDSFTLKNLKFSEKKPSEIWKEDNSIKGEIFHDNLFRMVEEKGGCGILTNIGISTPFVGVFGGAILVAELLKSLKKEKMISSFSGKMRTTGSYSFSTTLDAEIL